MSRRFSDTLSSQAPRRASETASLRIPVHITRRAGLALALLFIVSLPAVTPRLYASDEIEYFSFLRSLWFDHDVSFDNEYRYFYDRGLARTADFRETFLERATPTGRRENFGTLGCAILWAPFYGVADLGVRVFGGGVQAAGEEGYSRPYVAAVSYASALYGWLALVLSLVAARAILGGRRAEGTALAATLVVWLGTPLLFYMYIAPPMSHAVSAFAVAAFVVAWLRVRDRWSPGGAAVLGALAALMTMVREQDFFIAGGAVLDFALAFLAGRRRREEAAAPGAHQGGEEGRGAASGRQEAAGGRTGAGTAPGSIRRWVLAASSGVAAFALCFLPQALAYLAINGRLSPSATVGRKMAWWAPYAVNVLVSPEHGFLLWTPLAAFALAGLVLLAARPVPRPAAGGERLPAATRPDARLGACLLVMAALEVYISGCVRSWTVAGAFGQRRFVGLTVLLVIGVAVVLARLRGRAARVAVGAVLAASIWWNVALMMQFGSGMMDRQRLELGRNLYNAFVTVPREVPRLAWRYFFARDSFYRWGRGP
jgi:hypothetical protein